MIVRTVLGDIPPGDLGVTYSHEHLIIDSALVAQDWPHIHLPSTEEAVKEARLCARAGVGAMVDAMPTGSGRDLAKLADVSRAAGVHVIASTGMHTAKYYEAVQWAGDGPEELATRFIDEVRVGVSGIRTGVMKIATSGPEPTGPELALIEAAAVVHTETNVPILTHCEGGVGAVAQLDHLHHEGVPMNRVLLSHTDKVSDPAYHREILGSGANVEYDQSLRQYLGGSSTTAGLVASMWEEGFGPQIMLGTDGARRSLWETLGGSPGLAWLRSGFPTVLAEHGIGNDEVEAMFVTNPARVLSFEPI